MSTSAQTAPTLHPLPWHPPKLLKPATPANKTYTPGVMGGPQTMQNGGTITLNPGSPTPPWMTGGTGGSNYAPIVNVGNQPIINPAGPGGTTSSNGSVGVSQSGFWQIIDGQIVYWIIVNGEEQLITPIGSYTGPITIPNGQTGQYAYQGGQIVYVTTYNGALIIFIVQNGSVVLSGGGSTSGGNPGGYVWPTPPTTKYNNWWDALQSLEQAKYYIIKAGAEPPNGERAALLGVTNQAIAEAQQIYNDFIAVNK